MNIDFSPYFNFLKLISFEDYCVLTYLILFAVQVFYYLFFFSRLSFYNPKELKHKYEPVSIIICAKNERDNLLNYLPLYFSQNYPEFEVIVVNDNSSDDTEDVLKAFALQNKKIKIVNVPDTDQFFGSKKFALTLGIKAAKYNNLLLTDADCKPNSLEWIEKMSNYDANKELILGYGAYERKKGLLNLLIRYETFFTALQYFSYALAKLPYMGVGRNIAYKKDLFFNNKGFASHQHVLSGDDDLFVNQVANSKNTQIIICDQASTISIPKQSFKDWINQKKRHFMAGRHYKIKHKVLLSLYQISALLFISLFIYLIIVITPFHLILGVFLLRLLIQMLIFRFAGKKLHCVNLFWTAPILEVFFLIFNPAIHIANIIAKNTKWN